MEREVRALTSQIGVWPQQGQDLRPPARWAGGGALSSSGWGPLLSEVRGLSPSGKNSNSCD